MEKLTPKELQPVNIERANLSHVGLIEEQLRRIGKHPSQYEVLEAMDDANNFIRVEANREIVCKIRRDPQRQKNYVDWLFPQDKLSIDLYFVMCEALMDIHNAHPQCDFYTTQARFMTGRGCLSILGKGEDKGLKAVEAFQTLFPTSSQYKKQIRHPRDFPEGAWYIWGKHGEIVNDILQSPVYSRRSEVSHGPQISA